MDTRFLYSKSIEYFKISTMVIYVCWGFKNKRKIFPKFLRPNILSGLLWCSRTRIATVAQLVKQSSKQPTLVNDCFTKALHARHHLTQILKKKKAKNNIAKRKEACSKLKNAVDQAKDKRILTYLSYDKCGKAQPGEWKGYKPLFQVQQGRSLSSWMCHQAAKDNK